MKINWIQLLIFGVLIFVAGAIVGVIFAKPIFALNIPFVEESKLNYFDNSQIPDYKLNSTEQYKNYILNFYGVDESSKKMYSNHLDNIEDYYFIGIKSISFYENREMVFRNCPGLGTKLFGCTDNKGNIFLWDTDKYTENTLKELICHEILHNYFEVGNLEVEEAIVEDMGKTHICFKEGFR